MDNNKFIEKRIYNNLGNQELPFDDKSEKEIYYVTFNRCETKEDLKFINSFIRDLYTSATLKEENKSLENMIVVVDPALYFNVALLSGDALAVNSMIDPSDEDFTQIADDCYNYAYINMMQMASKIFIVNTDDSANIKIFEKAIMENSNFDKIISISVIYDATKYEYCKEGGINILFPKIENLVDEATDDYLRGLIQKIKDINYDIRKDLREEEKAN